MFLDENVNDGVADTGWDVVDDCDNPDEVGGVHVTVHQVGVIVVVAGATAFLEEDERLGEQGHHQTRQRAYKRKTSR